APPVGAREAAQGAAALRAVREPRQEVRALEVGRRRSPEESPPARTALRVRAGLRGQAEHRPRDAPPPRLRGLPQRIGHDAKVRRIEPEPFRLGPARALRRAPLIALPRLVPDDDAAVQLALEDRADRRAGPAASASAWWRHAAPVGSAGSASVASRRLAREG